MSEEETKDVQKAIKQLQQENKQLKDKLQQENNYFIQGGRGSGKTYITKLEQQLNLYKEVIEEVREYINSNPNVFYDEYLIDVETLKNNECIDDTVGEIKFISNLLQILDKVKENK